MAAPTLVVAVDLANNSAHVTDFAVEMAGRLKARVALVHAMTLAPGVRADTIVSAPGKEAIGALDLLEADARKHTAALVSLFEGAGIPTELVLGHGAPAEVIGNAASEQGAFMVLLGAPKTSRMPKLWGQDLCTAVVERCSAPVLLVKRTEKAEQTYSTAQFQMMAEVDG
ncbi:MAG: universal stress protein [Deltaproteobacteria bacterium]|nr:universal stress protein [Deltaproteobacteria bacterium]